jgi:Rieske Fe-S protein
MSTSTEQTAGRRSFLVRTVIAVQGAIGAVVASVVGGTILAPSFAAHRQSWLRAAAVSDLHDGEPTPVTLRIIRQDGYRQVVDRRVVYLRRDAQGGIRVLDSTCTHLGCRTRYDAATKQFLCPCHGGVYDMDGAVVAGPPPAPLRSIQAKVERGNVVVQV